MKDSSKTLITLSEIDGEIQNLSVQKKEIEKRREELSFKLERVKERLQQVDTAHKDSVARQSLEETRLKDEESKIVERRKQLTSLGGAKSAKLVERELDIATRVMESMEQNAMSALETAERMSRERDALQEKFDELDAELKDDASSNKSTISDIEKQLTSLGKKRDTQLEKLNDRLRNLYKKVSTRYPGDAVAIATGGACRSCYRALPAQTYNQVIAGNMLLQCPGCSRILLYRGEQASEARA